MAALVLQYIVLAFKANSVSCAKRLGYGENTEITKMPTSEWLNKLYFHMTEDNAALMNDEDPLFDGHRNQAMS